jgi:ribosomal protein S18 acetylase RimI-like enzyme
MNLNVATEADINNLMSWFPTERSVDLWGGPKFRYPFTPETFHEDVHWRDMDSYCIVDSSEELLAFGQFYERHGRINLARLVVSPDRRRQGVGKQLVRLLMEQGRRSIPRQEYSLYVYKDNHAAKACYADLGFEEDEYPEDDEMADSCLYMTRPI